MNSLIVKLGATGDVVRTTTLLRKLEGHITWITADKNTSLFEGAEERIRCLSWEDREKARDRDYDLIINLEDTDDVGEFAHKIKAKQTFGAYRNDAGKLDYTESSQGWFDLSLISRFGKEKADELKLANRRTYQDLIFEGMGYQFKGEPYVMPEPMPTDLTGDVAISPVAGPVWPMKNWAYYSDLQEELEKKGLRVNVLPKRDTLLEHLGDVRNHRCLVSGDSLPMHMALGTGTRCVSLFTCTGPWEIYDYGIQTQIASPVLDQYFFKRGFEERATTAITLKEVFNAVMDQLEHTT